MASLLIREGILPKGENLRRWPLEERGEEVKNIRKCCFSAILEYLKK